MESQDAFPRPVDAAAAQGDAHRSTWLSVLYPTLLILGGLALLLANLLIWVDTTLFNTATFTEAISNTFDQPKVHERVADVLATEVVNSGVIQDELNNQLPSQYTFVTPIVATQLDEVISRVARTVLAADFVGNLRDVAVRQLHARL